MVVPVGGREGLGGREGWNGFIEGYLGGGMM